MVHKFTMKMAETAIFVVIRALLVLYPALSTKLFTLSTVSTGKFENPVPLFSVLQKTDLSTFFSLMHIFGEYVDNVVHNLTGLYVLYIGLLYRLIYCYRQVLSSLIMKSDPPPSGSEGRLCHQS